jgi:D-sedoheptulose 7-phosphate isomerase
MISSIKSIIQESIDLKKSILDDEELITQILKAIAVIVSCLRNGKKIMIAGNGGSAADSQHMAAEFVGKLYSDRKPLPAIALTTDTSILTSISNDFSFSEVFVRQIQALGNAGDVLILISTSGNSFNLLKAAEESKKYGIITIGILGNNGGKLYDIVDIPLVIKHSNTQRIQESQLMIEHIICELVEKQLQS